jgi:hypothetical protein
MKDEKPPFLNEDDLIVLSLAADGERMMPIGRWEVPTLKLLKLGYLTQNPDKFNCTITEAGRARWAIEERAELQAIIQLNNMMVEQKAEDEDDEHPEGRFLS